MTVTVYIVLTDPHGFRVERRTITADGITGVHLTTRRHLPSARSVIPAGLTRSPRRDDDVPRIVEVWL